MPVVVFVLGFCGSGKSTRAAALTSDGFVTFDEQVTGRTVHPNLQAWPNSAYGDLMRSVREGCNCVVTEILFYVPEAQQMVTRDLKSSRPDVLIHWECFTDFESANHNCVHDPDRTQARIRDNLQQNLNTLAYLQSGAYALPPGHKVLPTVRRAATP